MAAHNGLALQLSEGVQGNSRENPFTLQTYGKNNPSWIAPDNSSVIQRNKNSSGVSTTPNFLDSAGYSTSEGSALIANPPTIDTNNTTESANFNARGTGAFDNQYAKGTTWDSVTGEEIAPPSKPASIALGWAGIGVGVLEGLVAYKGIQEARKTNAFNRANIMEDRERFATNRANINRVST